MKPAKTSAEQINAMIERIGQLIEQHNPEPLTYECRYGCRDTGFLCETRNVPHHGEVVFSKHCNCEKGNMLAVGHERANTRDQARELKRQMKLRKADDAAEKIVKGPWKIGDDDELPF